MTGLFQTSLLKGRKFWFQKYKVPIWKIEHSDLKVQISNMRNRKFQFEKRKIPIIELEIENWTNNGTKDKYVMVQEAYL